MKNIFKNLNFDYSDKSDAVEFQTSKELFLHKILPVLTLSGVSGVAVGVIVFVFNILLDLLSEHSAKIISLVHENLPYAPLYILGAGLLGLLGAFIVKKLPEARGSGLPHTELMLNGKKKMSWWRMSIASFFGTLVSYAAGMPIGSEGPSVQLGAGIASGVDTFGEKCCPGKFNRKKSRNTSIFNAKNSPNNAVFLGNSGGNINTKRKGNWSKFVANSGAAAGFATAFGTPVCAIFFVQEEVVRKLNPLMIASCAMAVAFSYLTDELLSAAVGIKNLLFTMPGGVNLPLNFMWTVVVIAIVCAILSRGFNDILFFSAKHGVKNKRLSYAIIVAVFLIVALVDVFYTSSAGSGIGGIRKLLGGADGFTLSSSAVLLVVRFALIAMCFYAGVTGGLMVPMFALGSLIGAVLGFAFIAAGMPSACFGTVVLISMCCFFGNNVGAPFTVIILFLEITGGFSGVVPIVLAVAISQLASLILRTKPLYDTLGESAIDKNMLPTSIR